MNQAARRAWLGGFAIAGVLALGALPGWAAPAEEGAKIPPAAGVAELRYREVKVPLEALDQFTAGYLPLARTRFADFLARQATLAARGAGDFETQFVGAQYAARLADDQLVEGTARCQVVHRGERPAWLSLGEFNLAADRVQWEDDPPLEAVWGSHGRTSYVWVPKSGELRFHWSLRAEPQSGTTKRFSAQLAPSVASHLVLDLPIGVRPLVEGGVVEGSVNLPAAGVNGSSARPIAAQETARKEWRIRLRGAALNLALHAARELATAEPPRVRMNARYLLNESGGAYEARWELAAGHWPAALTLEIDPGLEITAARLGEEALAIAENPPPANTAAAAGQATPRQLTLTLPPDASTRAAALELSGVVFPKIGEAWQAPRIRCPGVMWQEGKSIIEVAEPLAVMAVRPRQARQTRLDRLTTSPAGERLELQEFGPDAVLDCDLGVPRSHSNFATATTLEWSAGLLRARQAIRLDVQEGKLQRLAGSLARDWVLDAVESDPPELLDDWSVEVGGGGQQLFVSLRKAVKAGEAARFVLRAHRPTATVDTVLSLDQLRLAEFPQWHATERLVALKAVPPLRVAPQGGLHSHLLSPSQLAADEAALLALDGQFLLVRDTGEPHQQLALRSEQARFSATVALEAAVSGDGVQEKLRIRCVPESGRLDRLRVVVNEIGEAPPAWLWTTSTNSRETESLRAKLLAAAPAANGKQAAAQMWEIGLPRAMTEPFEIVATRQLPMAASVSMGLAAVPDAARQQGTVRIVAQEGPLPKITVPGLEPRLDAAGPATGGGSVLFQFAPDRAAYEVGSAVVIEPAAHENRLACRAWRVRHQVHVAAPGAALGISTFFVENRGQLSCALQLPAGARARLLHRNNEVLPLATAALATGLLPVALPPDQRYVMLVLEYEATLGSLPWAGQREIPVPEIDLPVLDERLNVWLPSGWQALASAGDSQAWRKFSLLGPLLPNRKGPSDLENGATAPLEMALPLAAFENEGAANPEGAAQGHRPPPASAAVALAGWSGAEPRPLDLAAPQVSYALERGEIPVVRVASRTRWQLLGWGVLLLSALAVGMGAGRFPLLAVALVALSGVLLLGAAPHWFPLGEGGLAGTLLGFARRRWRAATPREPSDPASVSTLIAPLPVGAACLAFAMLAWQISALAQESPRPAEEGPAAEPTSPHSPRVLTAINPTGENGAPAGDYLYVPRELYDALHQPQSASPLAAVPFLVRAGEYETTLSRRGDDTFQCGEFAVNLALETTTDAVEVVLPFSSDEVYIDLERSQLDGRPVRPTWNAEGSALLVPVAQAGSHRCELFVLPRANTTAAAGEVAFAVPRATSAQLSVQSPLESPRIEAPGGRGAAWQNQGNGKLAAELGPVERLTLRWGRAAAPRSQAVLIEGEQAYWLRLKPGSLALHTRFRILRPEGLPPRLRIPLPDSYRLLPVPADAGYTAELQESDGQRYVSLVPLKPVTPETRFELAFVAAGESAVGQYSLPLPELEGLSLARRYLALSADSSLEVVEGAPAATAEALPQFQEAWGPSGELPPTATSLAANNQVWRLRVQMREPAGLASENLRVRFQRDEAVFDYAAECEVASGTVFRHRVLAPPRATVSSVTFTHEGLTLPVRWALGSDGALTVFLPRALGGKQKLAVSLRAPFGEKSPAEVPLMRLANVRATGFHLTLVRAHDIQAEVVQHVGLEPVTPLAAGRQAEGGGRILAEFAAPPSDDSNPATARPLRVSVKLAPNLPQVTYTQTTELGVEKGEWSCLVHLRGALRGGELDRLEIEIPQAWCKGLAFDPPCTFRLHAPPGEPLARLTVTPHTPLLGSFHVRLSCVPEGTGETPLRAPVVKWLEYPSAEQWLLLPERDGQRRIEWNTLGLRQDGANSGPWGEKGPPAGKLPLRPLAADFQAEVRTVERAPRVASAPLCEIALALRDDLSLQGLAEWQLDPAGAESCLVYVPPQVTLVDLSLDGAPARMTTEPNHLVRVALPSRFLPQRLQALFLAPTSREGNHLRLETPHLAAWATARTLWTMIPATRQHSLALVRADAAATPLAHEMERLRASAGLLENVRELAAEHGTAELARWRQPWLADLREIQARLAEQALQAASDPFEPAEANVLVARLQERMAALVSVPEPAALQEVALPVAAAGTWRQQVLGERGAVRATIDDTLGEIELRVPPGVEGSTHQAWRVVLWLLAILPLLWRSVREQCTAWLLRWHFLAASLAGFAWWAWLEPAWLGLGVALVSVLAATWEMSRLLASRVAPAPRRESHPL